MALNSDESLNLPPTEEINSETQVRMIQISASNQTNHQISELHQVTKTDALKLEELQIESNTSTRLSEDSSIALTLSQSHKIISVSKHLGNVKADTNNHAGETVTFDSSFARPFSPNSSTTDYLGHSPSSSCMLGSPTSFAFASARFTRSRTLGMSNTKDTVSSSQTGDDDELKHRARSQSLPNRDLWTREAACKAIENLATHLPNTSNTNVRQNVRHMYSFRIRDFPYDIYRQANLEVKRHYTWRPIVCELDQEGLWCWGEQSPSPFRNKAFRVVGDDILGARMNDVGNILNLHFMKPGKGENEKKLRRRHYVLQLRFTTREEAELWEHSIQSLVQWFARVPSGRQRKIKVIVNPHSGRRQGLKIWQHWQPILELAGIECHVEKTERSGHARDMGLQFDLEMKYEAIVFVGGDGTVNEFMNGVFLREESEWRRLVATTPISLLCAGTDNAFGIGAGIPTHASAVYCIIRRKIRPLDVATIAADPIDGVPRRQFALCGVSYGVGSDIAVESEQTRWLGVHRYMWLKVKRGVLAPRRHDVKIKYVLSEKATVDAVTKEQLFQTYYEIVDNGAQDQHHIEMCSVYEPDSIQQQWDGESRPIFHPAQDETYDGQWHYKEGTFTTVGASNLYFETEFYHPSDGMLDLVMSRKGNLTETVAVGANYIAGNYLRSPLVDYFKVKAIVIEPARDDPINVDGEVFPGPGPFRIEVVPHLLCVLSEK